MNSNCKNESAFVQTISEIGQSNDCKKTTDGRYFINNCNCIHFKRKNIKLIMFLPVLLFFIVSLNTAFSQPSVYNVFPTYAPWRTAVGGAQITSPNFKPLQLHTSSLFDWGGIPNNDPVFKISFGEDQTSQLSYGQLLLISPENNRPPNEVYSNIANYNPATSHGDFVLQASYRAEDLILTTRSAEGCIRFGTSPSTNNDIERMTILPNGFVGINKTTPAYNLDLNGTCRISSLVSTSTRMVVANPYGVLSTQPIPTCESGNIHWALEGNTLTTGNEFLGTINNYNLNIRTNNRERLKIMSSNGFVGIGFPWYAEPTLEPIATFDVQVHPWYKQSKVTLATNKMNDIANSSANTSIRLYRPINGDVLHAYPWWMENRLAGDLGGIDGSLHFRTTMQNDIAAGDEDPEVNPNSQLKSIMTLQRNGKVGINTTSPRGFLDVAMDPGWNETKISMDILNHQPSLRFYKNTGVDHPECPNGRWSETYQWWLQLSDFEGAWGSFQLLTRPPSCYPNDEVSPVMTFLPNGNVGIGVSIPHQKLVVDGTVCAKEVRVSLSGSPCWSDYVFDSNYKLMPLNELENFVKNEKHLPDIPTENEVSSDGIELGAMQAKLVKKIEELTLYVIELKKENEEIKKQLKNTQVK